jgi:hypothetical protein
MVLRVSADLDAGTALEHHARTRAGEQDMKEAMSTPSTDPTADLAHEANPLLQLTGNETFIRAREACTRLVRKYPASTVLGAFAVGFALARLFRRMSREY